MTSARLSRRSSWGCAMTTPDAWAFDPLRVAATEGENTALRDSLGLPATPPVRTAKDADRDQD
jgi:hypothetical protein